METSRVDGVATLDQCLGVDLDGLHARLVRVAYTRFADGVVAAARAEHVFVALCSSRRVLLSLLREALLYMCLRGRETLRRGAVVKAGIDVVLSASTDEL